MALNLTPEQIIDLSNRIIAGGSLDNSILNIIIAKWDSEQGFNDPIEIDWSKVKFDHLRADSDGQWHSYESDDLDFDGYTWMRGEDNYCDWNHEEHINFIHPNPAESIYTRPNV